MHRFCSSLFVLGTLICVAHFGHEESAKIDSTTSGDTTDITEKLAELEQQHLESMKEKLRTTLRKNFSRNERGFREEFGKDATKDEIIEALVKEFEETYKKRAKIPTDEKLGLAFQYLEESIPDIPELLGISTTWKTTEHTTLFFIVTTSLAKHYNMPDDKVKKLKSVIEQLIEVVPESHQELLEIDTKHYTHALALQFKILFEETQELDQDKMELIKIRNEVRSLNENAVIKNIDRFVSCVDDVHRRADKEFIKLFSSLTRRLEKTVATVEKWLSHADEAVRFRQIDHAIIKSVVPLTPSVRRMTKRVPGRNCYFGVDVDSIQDDYSIRLGDPNET